MTNHHLDLLGSTAFEHLVTSLALRVLGPGATGFAAGRDGGRDTLFEGEAPYPSDSDRWSGTWIIQSKFLDPATRTSTTPWLLGQLKKELSDFETQEDRPRPDIWIIASNVEASGVPRTGAYDAARALVREKAPWVSHFDIWGGRKLIDFLHQYPDVAAQYRHLLTTGRALQSILDSLATNDGATAKLVIEHLTVRAIIDHRHTKLEQAGDRSDERPDVHDLFVDLPLRCGTNSDERLYALREAHLASEASHVLTDLSSRRPHRPDDAPFAHRARTWVLTGGPGQGKSTVTQQLAQIHRACWIKKLRKSKGLPPKVSAIVDGVEHYATQSAVWPSHPRLPFPVDLKHYAQWWYQAIHANEPTGVLSYLSASLTHRIQQNVSVATLRSIFSDSDLRYLFIFDGLDEVPSDVKDPLSREVCSFIDQEVSTSDAFSICTTRPQGYSGQFARLYSAVTCELVPLNPQEAEACASKLVAFGRPDTEAERNLSVLRNASNSGTISSIMRSPLQAHIIGVLVRSGQRPPERRWDLFRQFFSIIREREANRDLPNRELNRVLSSEVELIAELHGLLGFVLHCRAERSAGAAAAVTRDEFASLARHAVRRLKGEDAGQLANVLLKAAEERLVLISTPDSRDEIRFDIRQFQEFFAAEWLCSQMNPSVFTDAMDAIVGDSHWREVTHFVVSALVANKRWSELSAVVEAIRRLDNGEEEQFHLNRTLGRGAYTLLHLCADDVLEPDLRVRHRFDGLLEPVVLHADLRILEVLLRVEGDATWRWINEQLLRSIEQSRDECCKGAAKVLWRKSRSSSQHLLDRFRCILLERPRLLVSALDGETRTYPRQRRLTLPDWKVDVVIDVSLTANACSLPTYWWVRTIGFVFGEKESFVAHVRARVGDAAAEIVSLLSSFFSERDAKPDPHVPWLARHSVDDGVRQQLQKTREFLKESPPLDGVWGVLADRICSGAEHAGPLADPHSWSDDPVGFFLKERTGYHWSIGDDSSFDPERIIAIIRGEDDDYSAIMRVIAWVGWALRTPSEDAAKNCEATECVLQLLKEQPRLSTLVPVACFGLLLKQSEDCIKVLLETERVFGGSWLSGGLHWHIEPLDSTSIALAPVMLTELAELLVRERVEFGRLDPDGVGSSWRTPSARVLAAELVRDVDLSMLSACGSAATQFAAVLILSMSGRVDCGQFVAVVDDASMRMSPRDASLVVEALCAISSALDWLSDRRLMALVSRLLRIAGERLFDDVPSSLLAWREHSTAPVLTSHVREIMDLSVPLERR